MLRKKIAIISISFLAVLSFPATEYVFAAEVYYLGAPVNPEQQGEIIYPNYSLAERIHDLFDFSSMENDPKRSGRISGSVLGQMDYRNISGNKGKSFYEEGVDYLSEVNINAYERIWRDINFEGRAFLRKTDDRRIEPRRDVRLKDINLKVLNSNHMLEFGDFYTELSPYTLSNSLEGFNIETTQLHGAVKSHTVLARRYRSNIAADRYQRNVAGQKIDWMPFLNSGFFSLFRLGAQVTTTQDDSSTKSASTNTPDLDNTVVSIDGDVNLPKYVTLNYEIARSFYEADDDGVGDGDDKRGLAFRLKPSFAYGGWLIFRYLYEYVQPDFYTDTGSAQPDKTQHQFSLDLVPHERFRLSLVENWYWDHLTKSLLAERSINDEKYATLYIRPLEDRKQMYLRPYVSYLERNSTNPDNTGEQDTTTVGIGLDDVLYGTQLGVRYEYRASVYEHNRTSSDYFSRMGFSASRDWQVFKRRLYFSGDAAFDFRNTKQEDDNDITSGITANCQYDLFQNLVFRGGYNIQDFAAAAAISGYRNQRTFGELDYLINKSRSAHLISKVEQNDYDHEDGTQSYEEFMAITKILTQF